MKNLINIFLVLFFSTSSLAFAEFPNSVEKKFLIGSATLKFLRMKVYDISLWSVEPKFSYSKPFAIQIKYNLNFSSQDLVKRSIAEIERLHELTGEEKKSYAKDLAIIFRSVKKGDEKLAIFSPEKGVKMLYNNELTGVISDPKLARLFVDIWLDERGSYPEVTRKLLGK